MVHTQHELVEATAHPFESRLIYFLKNIFHLQKGRDRVCSKALQRSEPPYLLCGQRTEKEHPWGCGGLNSRRVGGMTQTLPHPVFHMSGVPSGHQEPRSRSLPTPAFGFSGLKAKHKEKGPTAALLPWVGSKRVIIARGQRAWSPGVQSDLCVTC